MAYSPIMQKHIMIAIEAAGNPISLAWLIERLESDNVALRIGAIHTLERVARESPEAHWPIMEFLCDYLQTHGSWDGRETAPFAIGRLERQAILSALGRRTRAHEYGKEARLNLVGLDLRGVNLIGAHLERCYLNGTHLDGAALGACHLEYASCEGVVFDDAWMPGASLLGTALRGASFTGARLARAVFTGADLQKAQLDGVDLRQVRGLTRLQVARAISDKKTQWPLYLATEAGVN